MDLAGTHTQAAHGLNFHEAPPWQAGLWLPSMPPSFVYCVCARGCMSGRVPVRSGACTVGSTVVSALDTLAGKRVKTAGFQSSFCSARSFILSPGETFSNRQIAALSVFLQDFSHHSALHAASSCRQERNSAIDRLLHCQRFCRISVIIMLCTQLHPVARRDIQQPTDCCIVSVSAGFQSSFCSARSFILSPGETFSKRQIAALSAFLQEDI